MVPGALLLPAVGWPHRYSALGFQRRPLGKLRAGRKSCKLHPPRQPSPPRLVFEESQRLVLAMGLADRKQFYSHHSH